jgi:hypothetical protein
VAVGARGEGEEVCYPVAEVAQKHGASVLEDTTSGAEAYARFSPVVERPYREGDLEQVRV